MQSAPSTESTGTMLMHPCLRLRYARALLTNSQDLCPRRIVLVTNCAICPMGKIVRVGLIEHRRHIMITNGTLIEH